MREIVAALATQHEELAGLLDGLGDDGWARPSPCEGWSVADVVLHLAQTDELAIASAEGRFPAAVESRAAAIGTAGSVDDWADRAVAVDRGVPGPAIGDRWAASAAQLRDVLAACDPHARVQWVAGDLSARTLATTRVAECWIHTGDVAEALGVSLPPTDRLRHIARLAWRTLPYAFAQAGRPPPGPTAFHLRGPGGATWRFVPEDEPVNVVTGDALELCLVAGRRVEATATSLAAEGPDAAAVLELVRTYA